MNAAYRILSYIKGTSGYGILLQACHDLSLSTCCDSRLGSLSPCTTSFGSEYLVTLGGPPISWKTKKQTTVLGSSAEAKYHSIAAVTSELVWSKSLLASFGMFHRQPMHLFCDSQAALHIAWNPVFHERTKYIEIDCHFVHERYHSGELDLSYIPLKTQLADISTKALGK